MTHLLTSRRTPAPRGRSAPARWPWVALVLVGLAAGLGGPAVLDARAAAQYPVTAADHAAGLAALDSLVVKGRAPRTGYDREEFGPAWQDVDRNGCDTRNDVLRRDLAEIVVKPDTQGCVVLSGTLQDPYTATVIAFERGPRSSEVQIDHVVALADAWQKGAQGWDAATRAAFANDPANLLAVDGSANQSKGAGDAATWLPPNTGYRCAYALRQTVVKAAYGLWVTQAEHDALARWIDRCVVVG